jgi:hypothetical protein
MGNNLTGELLRGFLGESSTLAAWEAAASLGN